MKSRVRYVVVAVGVWSDGKITIIRTPIGPDAKRYEPQYNLYTNVSEKNWRMMQEVSDKMFDRKSISDIAALYTIREDRRDWL
jgi:hypothetical protein